MDFIKTASFNIAAYIRGDATAQLLAIVLPGRLDTKDYINNTSLVDHLASLGYLAVSFDPPGTWDCQGDIAKYSTTTYLKAVMKQLIILTADQLCSLAIAEEAASQC